MGKPMKPGEQVSRPGQYEEVGPRGGRTGHEVTMPGDHRLPPTSKPGNGYVPSDYSRNRAGRGGK